MLLRFRKKGGFFQLLYLIESCEPQKQKSLLHTVALEDPGWAHLIRLKMLSLHKVLSWPQQALEELVPQLSDQMVAVLYFELNDVDRERWINAVSYKKTHKIKELIEHLKPTSAEKSTATLKLIQKIRELESSGEFNPYVYDPALMVEAQIAS